MINLVLNFSVRIPLVFEVKLISSVKISIADGYVDFKLVLLELCIKYYSFTMNHLSVQLMVHGRPDSPPSFQWDGSGCARVSKVYSYNQAFC